MDIIQDTEYMNKVSKQFYALSNREALPESTTRVEKALSRTYMENSTIEVQMISDSEIHYKCQNRLFFCCDNKWSSGHCCKKWELQVIMVPEEIDDAILDRTSVV